MEQDTRSLGPDFNKLWAAQTISQFGSWLGALGLLAIITLDATPAQMGLLETLRAAPVLVFGLFAGLWADRLRRRPILIWADAGRAILLGLTALAAVSGRLQIEILYIVGFAVGALTIFFNVAYRAYLPSLVLRERLVGANSRLTGSESLAEIASPGLGGFLVQAIGAPLTLLADAGSFLLSALFVGRIKKPEVGRHVDGDQSSRQNAWREIGAGLRFIAHHPVLRALTGAAATSSFFGGFYAALYALYVLKAVGLNTTTLGLLIGAGGIGGLAGSFQAGRVSHRWGTGRALIVTLLLASALNLLIPLARNPGWAAILLLFFAQLVGDFFGVIYNIVETSVRQAAAPDAMLGRVTASYDFVAYGIGTIGIFVGGLMGSAIGMRNALIVAAFGLMSAAIWLLASPVRHMDRPPTEKGP